MLRRQRRAPSGSEARAPPTGVLLEDPAAAVPLLTITLRPRARAGRLGAGEKGAVCPRQRGFQCSVGCVARGYPLRHGRKYSRHRRKRKRSCLLPSRCAIQWPLPSPPSQLHLCSRLPTLGGGVLAGTVVESKKVAVAKAPFRPFRGGGGSESSTQVEDRRGRDRGNGTNTSEHPRHPQNNSMTSRPASRQHNQR
jgi:hypothetical protein